MTPAITLPGDYTVSENHGTRLEFSSRMYDRKAGRVVIVYELHNGNMISGRPDPDGWLGPKVTVTVTKIGTTIKKLDGRMKELPNIKWTTAAVQALVSDAEITKMNTFLTNQGGDLRTEP